MLHCCRALTLMRIMGSHLKVAISVPSKPRSVTFSFPFNFFSGSILFQGSFTSQHYTVLHRALHVLSHACVFRYTYIDPVMHEGSLG